MSNSPYTSTPYNQPFAPVNRSTRAPSAPGAPLAQHGHANPTRSYSHQRHPTAPSTPYDPYHSKPSSRYQHDSGYHGTPDSSLEVPGYQTHLNPPYQNPSPYQSYDSLHTSTSSGPSTKSKFDDIPESFSQLDLSPHSSASNHSKSSSVGRFFPQRMRQQSPPSGNRYHMDYNSIPKSDFNNPSGGGNRQLQRLSDDGTNSSGGGSSKSGKKRSGFSSLFSGAFGSDRKKIEISAPSNPTHLCHVGFNNQTGEYEVRVEIFGGQNADADHCASMPEEVQLKLLTKIRRVYPRNGKRYWRTAESPRTNRDAIQKR